MTRSGLLLLTGPPCSGKSSVGRALTSERLPGEAVPIEIDSLFDVLFPGSDRNRRDRMLAYDAAHELARMFVERGKLGVLECTYSRREQRTSLVAAMASLPTAPLWVVEFEVGPEQAVERWHQRAQPGDLTEHLVRKRAVTFPYSARSLRLDTSVAAPTELARRIALWLDGEPSSVCRAAWAAEGNEWD